MRFLRRNKKVQKTILVISDIHLGAGAVVNGKRNNLEDFEADQEMVEFLKFYSDKEYHSAEVELIINGDFLDLLAVPFVPYFDDEFWSEKASLEKLEIILKAHPEVIDALASFVNAKNKKLVYIIGNHDAELIFDSLQERFLEIFDEADREKVTLSKDILTYSPTVGVFLEHGHSYELAHQYTVQESIIETNKGDKYFIPSWGSYYVTHVINKYKSERDHVNAVRPIKNFLIHGFIFDTFFITRFLIANAFYFVMVRFLYYYRSKIGLRKVFQESLNQLTLFEDYETLTREFFQRNPEAKVLIVGHTHEPTLREYADGTTFINTGTWTKMINLELNTKKDDSALTYAKIQIAKKDYVIEEFNENVSVELNKWEPKTDLPYSQYS
jgi:UDP-2,3-diacylglucosamine pyrophosphatase LpxH